MVPNSDYKFYSIIQNGKRRYIEEPSADLKVKQQELLQKLLVYPVSSACVAIKGKNTLDNAALHQHAKWLLRIDIKKCYQYINSSHLYPILGKDEIWSTVQSQCFIQKEINGLLIEMLPTGAPTSPILCNLALSKLDEEVMTLLSPYDCMYTRYIDDLIISSENYIPKIKDKIFHLLYSYQLKPNLKKSRWFNKEKAHPFIVTGIRLKGQSKVPRSFSRKLRAKLNNLAFNQQDLDPEAQGCLSYVKALDSKMYDYFVDYYNKRKVYGVSAPRTSISS